MEEKPQIKKIGIEIQGELDALHIIWSLLEEILNEIPEVRHREDERYTTLVAVQEATTNVIRHAYKGDFSNPFKVEIEALGPKVTITIIDYGPPFDPDFHMKEPNEEDPAEGGYGIYIMKSVMDTIEYKRMEDKNYLIMVKDFSLQPVSNKEEGV